VRNEIRGGNAEITGSFTQREAFELSNVLNNPLDLPLRVVEMSEVGPSLARDSVESGKMAFLLGISITAMFIVIYYTSAGFLAVLVSDLRSTRQSEAPAWYPKLRWPLTVAVVVCLVVGATA